MKVKQTKTSVETIQKPTNKRNIRSITRKSVWLALLQKWRLQFQEETKKNGHWSQKVLVFRVYSIHTWVTRFKCYLFISFWFFFIVRLFICSNHDVSICGRLVYRVYAKREFGCFISFSLLRGLSKRWACLTCFCH